MKTELNTLKELVLTIIKQQERPGTLALLMLEAERLPDAITANTFTLSTNKQVQDYLFWQQDQLIKEANLLYKYCSEMPRLIASKGLVVILNVLKALNRIFPKQFDNNLSLPQAVYFRQCRRYEPVVKKFDAEFRKHGITEQLADIAFYPLSRFVKNKLPAKYGDAKFVAKYSTILLEMDLSDLKPSDAEKKLSTRLITANYNGLALMDFISAKVKGELEAVVTKKEKEIILKRFKIWLKPIPVMINLIFDKNLPTLKKALLDWAGLEEETLALMPDQNKRTRIATETIPEKLDLSVAVLAYWTRLWKINKVFTRKTHAEVVDHVVQTYCTKNTTRISRNSFYNCYKAPTTSAARALRKLLRALLEDVDHFISTGVVKEQ